MKGNCKAKTANLFLFSSNSQTKNSSFLIPLFDRHKHHTTSHNHKVWFYSIQNTNRYNIILMLMMTMVLLISQTLQGGKIFPFGLTLILVKKRGFNIIMLTAMIMMTSRTIQTWVENFLSGNFHL